MVFIVCVGCMKPKFSVADLLCGLLPIRGFPWRIIIGSTSRKKIGIRRLQPIMYALILPTHAAQIARFVESGRRNRCRCHSSIIPKSSHIQSPDAFVYYSCRFQLLLYNVEIMAKQIKRNFSDDFEIFTFRAIYYLNFITLRSAEKHFHHLNLNLRDELTDHKEPI